MHLITKVLNAPVTTNDSRSGIANKILSVRIIICSNTFLAGVLYAADHIRRCHALWNHGDAVRVADSLWVIT